MPLGRLAVQAEVHVASGHDTGVPRAFAAQRLGVSPHTISMWVRDGWLDPTGVRHHIRIVGRQGRQRLYRWGDLVNAETDTRNNPNSRRGTTPRRREQSAAA